MNKNPVIYADYPDPDVIRVDDAYYMVCTTMHFMPGCTILRSYDLMNWETFTHVYDVLDNTPGQRLVENQHIYGKGMWAASLRHHQGRFYICFVANDTRKTYLFTSTDIAGPWTKQYIEGFYHDCSLLFDDDGRVYIIHGNMEIHLTELKEDLSGPKPGGLSRVVVRDNKAEVHLGYEGAHLYKINGRYYVFFIHIPKSEGRRTQACFSADSLDGEFEGGEIFSDDMDFFNSGVAQGGIVDTPDGKWYSVLFQDYGAVGRIPVVVPLQWENNLPVLDKKAPHFLDIPSTRPEHIYRPLIGGDSFEYSPDETGKIRLKEFWEWNHTPDDSLWSVTERPGAYRIRSGKLSPNLNFAVNTLTQRAMGPVCEAEVRVDGSGLNNGDYAGICFLISTYGFIALTREAGSLYLVMRARSNGDKSIFGKLVDSEPGEEYARIPLSGNRVALRARGNFIRKTDECVFYYQDGVEWKQLGVPHQLIWKMDQFVGARIGLFLYSTQQTGGMADFSDFQYGVTEE